MIRLMTLTRTSRQLSWRGRRGAVPSGVFDLRGVESYLTVRRAPRSEKTSLGAVHRRPQQEAGEKCGLRPIGVVMLALGLAGSGFAGDHFLEEPLVTDRPDFTESSSTVGRGLLQLEGGFTFAEFEGGAEVTTLGEVLARWGVAPKLELRFVLPIYAWERGSGDDRSGFTDSAVGLKYELAQGLGSGLIGGMEAALIASTTVPTGGAAFGSSSWQPVGVLCLGISVWPVPPVTASGSPAHGRARRWA